MVTRWAFCGLVALLAVQRIAELVHSRRNEAKIRAAGGREHAPGQFRIMALLHTAWFFAMIGEVLWLQPPFRAWLAAVAVCALVLGQLLRYAAIRTLGWRWSVRVMTVPGAPVVDGGIFRWVRHPNYVGVVIELAAAPLVHGAWITAAAFTVANGLLLAWRIRTEERALGADNDYERAFADRRRLIPTAPRAASSEATAS